MDEKEKFILEVFDLLESKIKNNDCTKQQTDALYDAALNILDVYATSNELADHYGKSVEAVHGLIKRKMLKKPKKNITLYSFRAFRKIAPNSWLRKKQ